MGITRSDIFSKEQNQIASVAKVIGHPARVAILQHLIKVNSCICGDIVDVVGLSQPTISQHLREMKKIGLIDGNIDGTKVCYCINVNMYKTFRTMFDSIFGHDLSKDNSNCSN